MPNDIAISVRGLSKSYTINHDEEKYPTLAGTIAQRLRNPLKRQKKETFWALKDVSFDIKKGDNTLSREKR
jgi:ABC-type polysaccharide/polyol phosphate transport system ATPase subunit